MIAADIFFVRTEDTWGWPAREVVREGSKGEQFFSWNAYLATIQKVKYFYFIVSPGFFVKNLTLT